MARPRPLTPFDRATTMVAVLPSPYDRMNADEPFPSTCRALWRHTRTRNAVSTRRPGVGRAHRLCACAGEELAANGLRLAVLVGGSRRRTHLAVGARIDCALGSADRSDWRSAGSRS